jgi:MarR family transcriptional regulator, temperature-dependent positive regulator of motility
MPVDFERYEPDAGDGGLRLTEGSNAYAILRFLADNPGTGFTPKEIAEGTALPRGSVGTTLTRLEERDLVRHKEPYWAIGEDDRLAAYASMLHGLDAANDRFGDEDWGNWEETAVDPRGRGTERR